MFSAIVDLLAILQMYAAFGRRQPCVFYCIASGVVNKFWSKYRKVKKNRCCLFIDGDVRGQSGATYGMAEAKFT